MPVNNYNSFCIFTASGQENLWDELIALTECIHLMTYFPTSRITVFSHSPKNTKRFFDSQCYDFSNTYIQEYFPNMIRKKIWHNITLFFKMCKTIYASDVICIWWGGLYYSAAEEKKSPLFLWWIRTNIANIFKKKVVYLSIGISAKEKELKPYAHWLFSKTVISVRDQKSKWMLNKIWYNSSLLPDPVLTFVPKNYKLPHKEKKMIGIAIRRWYIDNSIIKNSISALLKDDYQVVLLPHSLHPLDTHSHDWYYLEQFLCPWVSVAQTIEQTLSYYEKCHIIIWMRLHSMILSICHHTPFISISYSQKTSELISQLWWKYSFDSIDTHEDIIVTISEIEKNYKDLTKYLTEQHQKLSSTYHIELKNILWSPH